MDRNRVKRVRQLARPKGACQETILKSSGLSRKGTEGVYGTAFG